MLSTGGSRGGFPTCVTILCSLLQTSTESLISPSPRLLLPNRHFPVNGDSSDIKDYIGMYIFVFFFFFLAISHVGSGGGRWRLWETMLHMGDARVHL